MARQPAESNVLPPKEAALFKAVVKHYETKQYKKGMKASDTILKKFPDHGETLAMKGLLLNCLDKKAEAYELVRLGVKKDIKSQVAWHVYGLLYRSDREYLQAIKCYRGALRHDPDNMKILRDLSMLQIQMRDLSGFLETRQRLLTIKPTNRMHWFTFALAQHLLGHFSAAIGVVDAYEKTLEGEPENDYEHGEMLLYKNMLYEERGDLTRALAHLDESEPEVVDKIGMKETKARILLQLRRFDEARAVYDAMLSRNPEHMGYHAGLQAATLRTTQVTERWLNKTIDAETEATLQKLYAELQQRFPSSTVCRRLPRDFARDLEYFQKAFVDYVSPYLRKGVPSLFADLKPLCERPELCKRIGENISSWLCSLEQSGRFPGEGQRELPSSIMWVRVLAAQYHDRCGDTPAALEQIEKAIEHSPTLVDLYLFKSRIYKHAGDLVSASHWMDEARKMDLADRYLNTKATRYMLRAGQPALAQTTVALFTKDGDQKSNLFDMQCMWYELELAGCYQRMGDFGRARKNFGSVDKHFNDIVEDQFDFHTYCVRKMTLRAYVRLLHLEDGLWGHPFYVRAAFGIIDTYLMIDDIPKNKAAAAATLLDDALSAAERKKAESKRRKAEAKAKAEAEAAAKAEVAAGKKDTGKKGGAGGNAKPADDDPDGKALASVDDPIAAASTYLSTLQQYASGNLGTWTRAFELAMRKRKFLLAMRALIKAKAIAPEDPSVHACVVRFLHETQEGGGQTLPPTVAQVIALHKSKKLGVADGSSLEQLNDDFLTLHGATSSAARIACIELKELICGDKAAAIQQLLSLKLGDTSIEQCVNVLKLIGGCTGYADVASAKRFKELAHQRFPYATAFSPPEGA